jgi:hypothetical protein
MFFYHTNNRFAIIFIVFQLPTTKFWIDYARRDRSKPFSSINVASAASTLSSAIVIIMFRFTIRNTFFFDNKNVLVCVGCIGIAGAFKI